MVQENSNESNEDNHAMDYDADESAQIQKKIEKKGKNVKRGIIYLSTIPKYMNITMIREMFSAYGKVGRVYLQLVDNETQSVKHKKKTKKVIKHFTEGWIEFESKKVAKFVAETLNNTQVSTRKKSKFYDIMWNIKYLPREINFFSYNVDRSKKLRRKHEQGEETTFELPEVKQRDTDNEIRNRKANTQVEDRTEFLKSIFG
ncbi:ESF2 protein, partial [Acromyrmex heyeri]